MVRAPGVTARTGTATDDQTRRDPRERRREDDTNKKRRHLFDLLFDEIDQVDGLSDVQRGRIRNNIRARIAAKVLDSQIRATQQAAHALEIAAQRAPPHAQHPPDPPPDGAAPDAPAEPLVRADPDQIIAFAAPQDSDQPPDELIENARMAELLRDCLARNTERARKVAIYLHLILALDGALRPHVVVDV